MRYIEIKHIAHQKSIVVYLFDEVERVLSLQLSLEYSQKKMQKRLGELKRDAYQFIELITANHVLSPKREQIKA